MLTRDRIVTTVMFAALIGCSSTKPQGMDGSGVTAGSGGSGATAGSGGSGGNPTGGSSGAGGSGGLAGSGGSGGTAGRDASAGRDGPAVDGPAPRLDGGAPDQGNPPPAGNSVTGMVNGMPFNMASNALWIGMPDAPATSSVVFLFQGPVTCAAIATAGWDARVANGQVIELKMGIPTSSGTVPMSFTVRLGNAMGTVAPGEADVRHGLTGAATTETIATGGTVTLSSRTAGQRAVGTFNVQYPTGTLTGSFDAMWCPMGVEP
jgi:hypothetical protein